jgi:hypothetical protein
LANLLFFWGGGGLGEPHEKNRDKLLSICNDK